MSAGRNVDSNHVEEPLTSEYGPLLWCSGWRYAQNREKPRKVMLHWLRSRDVLAVYDDHDDGAVHCWRFARSSFPHEFRIFPGSHCDQVPVTSHPAATFVKKRVRSPRLFAARQPVTPTSPEIDTPGGSGDSKQLSALGRDTEL